MRSRRQTIRRAQTHLRTYFLVGLGMILLAIFLTKFPLVGESKKQYVVQKNGLVEKVPAGTAAGELKKPLIEAMVKAPDSSQDVVAGNEFARLGVLDYYPGGYHVAYPDGFEISYTPTLFTAKSPAGGKVIVTISGQSFKVDTDLSGAPADQNPVIEAAARLASRTFRFLSGAGYDFKAAEARFSR